MEARSDEDGIIARLETATQRVVSSALACPLDSARRRRLDDDKSVNTIHVPSLYKDESQLLVNVLTPRELEYCSQQARQLQEECKYSITAVVEDLLPFGTYESVSTYTVHAVTCQSHSRSFLL